MKKNVFFLSLFYVLAQNTFAQFFDKKDSLYAHKNIEISLANNCKLYVNFVNQLWVRYTDTNPGTNVYGEPQKGVFDIGLRRTRFVISGSLYKGLNIFVQAGMNNFNYLSKREQGFFFHDVNADYAVKEDKFYIGGGLTSWGGFSRFSYPNVGTIMGVDAPIFAQATNGATDQFLRKLSIYTKGNLNKFQYRLAISKPMAFQNSSLNAPLNTMSNFSGKPPHIETHGYLEYMFFDKESHVAGYKKGTYLGEKKIFNIGAGFLHQKNAMARLSTNNDTITSDLMIFAIDAYYDAPMKNKNVLSIYAGYFNYNFGKGYLRNVGVMNPANGNNDATILNGAGSAFPMIGTGQAGYCQIGYSFHDKKDKQKVMPYTSVMIANYDKLNNNMVYSDSGINFFFDNHYSKITLAYQNRPIFKGNATDGFDKVARKGAIVTQFQFMF